MRGVYTANFRLSSIVSARTLFYITAASNRLVEVYTTEVSNESNETNEQLAICWQKVTSLGTPSATTVTPSKHESGDASPASTYKANVTASEPTYGLIAQGAAIVDVIGLQGHPSLSGYRFQPTPEERFIISGGDTWGLRLLIAPTSAIDIDVNITVREIG